MPTPHFNLPLNLPHAATVADRIVMVLAQTVARNLPENAPLFAVADELHAQLAPFRRLEHNPPPAESCAAQQAAATMARQLVSGIAARKLGNNRLGQCVRNLFECLELGAEGAELSLQAGEDPHSVQRPRARRLRPLNEAGHPRADAPPQPSGPDAPIPIHDELGPPVDDEAFFEIPPPPRSGRLAGGIIHDEDEGDDWTFDV